MLGVVTIVAVIFPQWISGLRREEEVEGEAAISKGRNLWRVRTLLWTQDPKVLKVSWSPQMNVGHNIPQIRSDPLWIGRSQVWIIREDNHQEHPKTWSGIVREMEKTDCATYVQGRVYLIGYSASMDGSPSQEEQEGTTIFSRGNGAMNRTWTSQQ